MTRGRKLQAKKKNQTKLSVSWTAREEREAIGFRDMKECIGLGV